MLITRVRKLIISTSLIEMATISTILRFIYLPCPLCDIWQLSAILCICALADFADIIAEISEIARKSISFISTACWFPAQFVYEQLGNLGNESLQYTPLLASRNYRRYCCPNLFRKFVLSYGFQHHINHKTCHQFYRFMQAVPNRIICKPQYPAI